MLGCIVLVQMHVAFVCIRFMAARASISPFVSLRWMRSMLCMFTYMHTRSDTLDHQTAPGCEECSSASPLYSGFLPVLEMFHRCVRPYIGHSPCHGAREGEFEQQRGHNKQRDKQRHDCEQQIRISRFCWENCRIQGTRKSCLFCTWVCPCNVDSSHDTTPKWFKSHRGYRYCLLLPLCGRK